MFAVQTQAADASDLTARIARGDTEAEQLFIERYRYGVHVLVRRHCRPGEPEIEDITQNVLMRVLVRLREGAIADYAALPAYIQTTIVHATAAEYRKRRSTDHSENTDFISSAEDPAETARQQQLTTTLRALLADLPVPRDREILRRFYLEEQDKDTVCASLGLDPAHFRRVVFRARERFKLVLQSAGIEET